MNREHWIATMGLALVVGLGATVLRIVYIFFPYMLLTEIVVFSALSSAIALWNPRRYWLSAVFLILPVMVHIAFSIRHLGLEKIAEGVGIGHVYSAFLIPVSALAGAYIGARIGARFARKREAPAEHVAWR